MIKNAGSWPATVAQPRSHHRTGLMRILQHPDDHQTLIIFLPLLLQKQAVSAHSYSEQISPKCTSKQQRLCCYLSQLWGNGGFWLRMQSGSVICWCLEQRTDIPLQSQTSTGGWASPQNGSLILILIRLLRWWLKASGKMPQ